MRSAKFIILLGITSLLSVLCHTRVHSHGFWSKHGFLHSSDARHHHGLELDPVHIPQFGHRLVGPSQNIEKRQDNAAARCRLFCSANSSCSNPSDCTSRKRALYSDFGSHNSTVVEHALAKRVFEELTQGQIGQHLLDLSETNQVNVAPEWVGNSYKPTVCMQQAWSTAPLVNGEFRVGMGSTVLEGCSVLAILSSRGVYMCHIWEDINYSNSNNHRFVGFQDFLDLVQNGRQSTNILGPGLDTSLFNQPGDNTQTWIMTPRRYRTPDDPDSQDYLAQYRQLYSLISRTLLPGVGMNNYNYQVPEQDQAYELDYQGVAFLEYDSDADGNGNADWRFWTEAVSATGRSYGQNPPGV
ncbi:hypothetical protein LTS15_008904 [Exophiala xenobiotica]|nr:hypothetical protein LTS15_008904 [Exophiala xenobiotica]